MVNSLNNKTNDKFTHNPGSRKRIAATAGLKQRIKNETPNNKTYVDDESNHSHDVGQPVLLVCDSLRGFASRRRPLGRRKAYLFIIWGKYTSGGGQ